MGTYLRNWRVIVRTTEWRTLAIDIIKGDIRRWDMQHVNTGITSETSRSLAVKLMKDLHDQSMNITDNTMDDTFKWRCIHDRDYLRRATAAQAFGQTHDDNLVLEAMMVNLGVADGFKWIEFMLTDDEAWGHKHCALRTAPAQPILLRP